MFGPPWAIVIMFMLVSQTWLRCLAAGWGRDGGEEKAAGRRESPNPNLPLRRPAGFSIRTRVLIQPITRDIKEISENVSLWV